ncbi:MAG TPA: hypothetical protein VN224_10785 [Xanthomonadales bacterium]|nr:hypothetical protein [Xanthomonadales bacterium]
MNVGRAGRALQTGGSVTDLATRRRSDDVLSSMSFVFGGIHYGTIPIAAPYTKGKPIVLYIVPQVPDSSRDVFSGPVDCLVTDDVALAADLDVAR